MSAGSSVYENKILLTKPFQASQNWHQLSVYENKILAQNCLQNEWTLSHNWEKLTVWSGCTFLIDFTSKLTQSPALFRRRLYIRRLTTWRAIYHNGLKYFLKVDFFHKIFLYFSRLHKSSQIQLLFFQVQFSNHTALMMLQCAAHRNKIAIFCTWKGPTK